jgi:ferredoxin--NADP+ reductase
LRGGRAPPHAKFTTKELRELGELPGVEVVVHGDEADLNAFDLAAEGVALAESDRRVRGNLVAITKWAQAAADPSPGPAASGHSRRLTVRFWLRPAEILGTERVEGLTLERTAISPDGKFGGTGEFETLDAQMVLRSVGYQSVPLPGVPFDTRASVVPNAQGRVLGEDGTPLPGEYVAGWLKRGPTGVIGTNKSDAAETVRCLLEDLAGGPGEDDVPLPRAGLLRYPDRPAEAADPLVQAAGPVPGVADPAADAAGDWPLAGLLAGRGIVPVSYAEWLRIETAEADLAKALGRGERVKLHNAEAIWSACRPRAE